LSLSLLLVHLFLIKYKDLLGNGSIYTRLLIIFFSLLNLMNIKNYDLIMIFLLY